MNTGLFRLIFNKYLGMLIPVWEGAQSQNGKKPSHKRALCITTALTSVALSVPALANPSGASVANGQVSFATHGSTLTITNSPDSIINWQKFSIGSGETTRFVQQSTASSVLNRVVGQDPSAILGTLQSNGRVFLINPNGILFGQGAKIDVGGLIASTLNLSDANFLAGKFDFTGDGGNGSIQNQGIISTPSGGSVYLIAPDIENSGIIHTPQGEVLLAAGHSVQLADSANPSLHVSITAPDGEAVNLGQIIAEGGKVGIFSGLVKQAGVISTSSAVADESGRIFIKASRKVTLESGSLTEANGAVGGGEITITSGESTVVAEAAKIEANAGQTGNGGKIIVWSDGDTQAHGEISARGGILGGNGGFVETSGHTINFAKLKVDAFAPNGKAGQWLIDPADITIDAIYAATIKGSLDGGTNVIVQTSGTEGDGLGSGDITVNSAINKAAGGDATLTLSAHNDIYINQNITSSSGRLDVNVIADSDKSGAGVTYLGPIDSVFLDLNGGKLDATKGSGNLDVTYATINGTVAAKSISSTWGEFTQNSSLTTDNLTLIATTLQGSGNINVTSNFNWRGSAIKGTGEINTHGNASLSGDNILSGKTWNNYGTAEQSVNGGLRLYDMGTGTTTFNNNGTFNMNLSTTSPIRGSGKSTFNNSGTLNWNKSGNLATLAFNNSGTVNVNESLNLFFTTGSNKGSFLISSNLVLGPSSSYTQAAGTTSLLGGSITGNVALNGGTLIGNGIITGDLTNNAGTVNPGPGPLSVSGNFTQGAAGTLSIDIGGKTAGTEYDVLNVGGTANLNGSLNISQQGTYNPDIGSIFTPVSFSNSNGNFSTLTVPAGWNMQPHTGSTALALEVIPPVTPTPVTPAPTISNTPALAQAVSSLTGQTALMIISPNAPSQYAAGLTRQAISIDNTTTTLAMSSPSTTAQAEQLAILAGADPTQVTTATAGGPDSANVEGGINQTDSTSPAASNAVANDVITAVSTNQKVSNETRLTCN